MDLIVISVVTGASLRISLGLRGMLASGILGAAIGYVQTWTASTEKFGRFFQNNCSSSV